MSRLVRLCKTFVDICRLSCPQAPPCIYAFFVAPVLDFCAWRPTKNFGLGQMEKWYSVGAGSWLEGWDDWSLCVSQMRRLSLVVLKWGINVAEVMTMMSTHHFLTRPLMCSVVIWHVSCKKAGLELAQGFPSSFISGDTLGQSHQARVMRVMARSDSKNYSKTLRKAPTTRTTRRRLRTTHRTTRTTPKTDRTTTRIILTTPRRKRTAPRTTRTTRWTT